MIIFLQLFLTAVCLVCFSLLCLKGFIFNILQGKEYDNTAFFVLGFLINSRLYIIIPQNFLFSSKTTLLSDKQLEVNSQLSRHEVGKEGRSSREVEVETNERT